jgi:hypothetical protein
MKNWRLAKALGQLRAELNPAFPGRSTVSDGAIGDADHSSRTSDHNPNDEGVVCAIDITHDIKSGCTGDRLAAALIKGKDARIKYIIWNRRMIRSYPAHGKPAWTWQPYDGANAHKHHLHISVAKDKKLYDSTEEWNLDFDIAVSNSKSELKAVGEPAIGAAIGAVSPQQPSVEAQPVADAANAQSAQTVEAGGTGVLIQPNALDSKPVSSPFDAPIEIIKGKAGNLLNYLTGGGAIAGIVAFVKDNPWLIVFFFTLVFLTVITIVLINHHKKIVEARTASDPDLYKVKFVKAKS